MQAIGMIVFLASLIRSSSKDFINRSTAATAATIITLAIVAISMATTIIITTTTRTSVDTIKTIISNQLRGKRECTNN